MDSQAIAPADSPAYRRMTDTERRLILELHDKGLPQTEIAHRLNRAQSSISDVIAAFTDTSDLATRYLRANAIGMAENIVKKGHARDHIQALSGLSVLNQQDRANLTLIINGLALHGTAQPETVEATFASEAQIVSEDIHRLTDETGSDNS